MDTQKLEKNLGYTFKNKDCLIKALTHSSKTNEDKALENNERLEFLGDAVLSLVVGDYLYKNLPGKKEGVLTKTRAMIVCADSLYKASEPLNLGEYISLGKGEINNGGKYKKNIIADCFEAVLGAVYLDSDYETICTIALRLLSDIIKKAISGNLTYDFKTMLQEYSHSTSKTSMEYMLDEVVGPEHNQVFTSSVFIEGKKYGTGSGQNKKESEQQAAMIALEKLGLL